VLDGLSFPHLGPALSRRLKQEVIELLPAYHARKVRPLEY
jgi:hypothetical protein